MGSGGRAEFTGILLSRGAVHTSASEMRASLAATGDSGRVGAPTQSSAPATAVAASARSANPAVVNRKSSAATGLTVAAAILAIAVGVWLRSGRSQGGEPAVAAVAPAGLAPALPAAPPPVPAAPVEPPFVAGPDSCKWTTSAQQSWLERGRSLSFSLRAAVRSPYYAVEATRPTIASGKVSNVLFTGKTGTRQVVVPGLEVLSVKTFAPNLDLEWVVAFWTANSLTTTDGPTEGIQEPFLGQSAVTITRITADSFETRIIRFVGDQATDENDGHFMHIRWEPARSMTDCLLRLGTNNGDFKKNFKPADPKLSRWMTLPSTPAAGWPTDGGGDWGAVGGFLNPLP